MGMTLAQKIIAAHKLEGDMTPGTPVASRIDQNLTQDAVYLAAGISRYTLQRVEAGAEMKLSTLLRIAHVLDVPLSRPYPRHAAQTRLNTSDPMYSPSNRTRTATAALVCLLSFMMYSSIFRAFALC